ncbi:MAG: hypothetical protein M0P19_06065 [Nevskia sp.]|jgi:hypothetical protein|nr:hypothetical protein [Nevskia sp.]MCK9385074.1 hypothetical protein [Nevskia sp.]
MHAQMIDLATLQSAERRDAWNKLTEHWPEMHAYLSGTELDPNAHQPHWIVGGITFFVLRGEPQ